MDPLVNNEEAPQTTGAKEIGIHGTRWNIGNPVLPPPGHEIKQPSQFGNCLFVKSVTPAGKVWLTRDPIHHSGDIGPFWHGNLVSNFTGENEQAKELLPAKYGSSACPNAPNACYCTGDCNKQPSQGDVALRRFFSSNAAAMPAGDIPKSAARHLSSFVEEHNQQKHVEPAPTAAELFSPIARVMSGLTDLLSYKNRKYGNTGLEPINVFSKGTTLEKLLARADDKVARIKNGQKLQKNDVADLMGYLALICAHQGWEDFADQQD